MCAHLWQYFMFSRLLNVKCSHRLVFSLFYFMCMWSSHTRCERALFIFIFISSFFCVETLIQHLIRLMLSTSDLKLSNIWASPSHIEQKETGGDKEIGNLLRIIKWKWAHAVRAWRWMLLLSLFFIMHIWHFVHYLHIFITFLCRLTAIT